MPKSPEQFDLSKLEDQQKFDKLSKKKRGKFIGESMEEATKMNEESSKRETTEEKAMSKERFEQKEKEIIEKLKSGQIKSWDKEASDFENEKEEEMKKFAPLFFIYRDNTLFKKHVPIIQKKLVEMGRQVDMQIFPQGTQEENIERWYKENKQLLSKKAIISDRTANIPYKMKDEIKYDLGARRIEYLLTLNN